MEYSKKKFADLADAAAFVNECEADFEARLKAAVDEVCSVENIRIVGLSGPTCSGKTTTAKKLVDGFSVLGRRVHVVSIDDFFKDAVKSENADEIDFDSIDALDFDEFKKCVDDIFNDKDVRIPIFDFITGKRSGYTEFDPDPSDIYIFEGIQAVYPEITALLNRGAGKSVYICAMEGINIDGVEFSPTEIRLMRRIVRDFNFRGASPEYTMFLWESVRRNEENNIFPNVGVCDIKINSTMPYEINLIVDFLRPLLLSVTEDSKYINTAKELLKKLEGIESIPQTLIPDNSLYYEFIKRI